MAKICLYYIFTMHRSVIALGIKDFFFATQIIHPTFDFMEHGSLAFKVIRLNTFFCLVPKGIANRLSVLARLYIYKCGNHAFGSAAGDIGKFNKFRLICLFIKYAIASGSCVAGAKINAKCPFGIFQSAEAEFTFNGIKGFFTRISRKKDNFMLAVFLDGFVINILIRKNQLGLQRSTFQMSNCHGFFQVFIKKRRFSVSDFGRIISEAQGKVILCANGNFICNSKIRITDGRYLFLLSTFVNSIHGFHGQILHFVIGHGFIISYIVFCLGSIFVVGFTLTVYYRIIITAFIRSYSKDLEKQFQVPFFIQAAETGVHKINVCIREAFLQEIHHAVTRRVFRHDEITETCLGIKIITIDIKFQFYHAVLDFF